jgi:hypothetical protein
VGSRENIEQFFSLLVFDYFIEDVSFEGVDTGNGFEADLYIVAFTGVYRDGVVRHYLDKLFLELL